MICIILDCKNTHFFHNKQDNLKKALIIVHISRPGKAGGGCVITDMIQGRVFGYRLFLNAGKLPNEKSAKI